MAITKLNSLAIPDNTIVEADLSYPLTGFSSTGIDDNATSTAMTLDSSGNVGIGTDSPSTALHVLSTGTSQARLTAGGTNLCQISFGDTADEDIGRIRYNNSDDELDFWTNASQAMLIDSSGNVGIGTGSAIDEKLHVEDQSAGAVTALVQNSNLTSLCSSKLQLSTSTAATRGGYVEAIMESGGSGGGQPSSLAFGTSTAFNAATERMRIDSSGNLLVGTTSGDSLLTVSKASLSHSVASFSNQSSVPAACLSLNYPNAAPNNSSQPFIIGIDSQGEEFRVTSAGAFVQASDRRIKSNIVEAKSAGSIIDAIKVREYDKGFENPQHWSYGFIAQEVYEVYPEAVHKPDNEEDRWGIDYIRLVPVLVKEIQDLKAEVAALKGA